MTDRQVQDKLKTAVDHAAPDQLACILSRCEQRKGNVIPMTKKNTNQKKHWIRYAVAACLALVLIGGVGGGVLYQQANAVASVVSLDVNPSIELQVNQKEKVLSAKALNAEAEEILADLPLEGTDLNVAVNAIVGSLLSHGYLESISSAILISVEDSDQARATRLQEGLTAQVGAALENQQANATILSQTFQADSTLEAQATQSNISVGKAALIQAIQKNNSQLSFDALAALSVEELSQMVETKATTMPIGRDKAKQIAMEYAGVTGSGSAIDVDAELDENPPHYEVEIETASGEFDYRIDAYTGEVLQGQANIGGTVTGGNGNGNSGSSGNGNAGNGNGGNSSNGNSSGSQDIGYEKAKSIAYADAGVSASAVQNVKVEKDWDDGRLEYEVEFWANNTEYEYTIAGADGTVLKRESEGSKVSGNVIGFNAARDAALKHAGLSQSDVYDLDVSDELDERTPHYEVDFKSGGMEYEYKIDAVSGAVLSHQTERDD